MTLFEEIVRDLNLLTEEASINDINTAINGLHPAWIKYDDTQGGGGKNRRYICPVAYGISTAGNPVVRAFQPQGSTKRGVPKWKLFRLDRIKFWRTVTSQSYDISQLQGFNEDGDKQMESLFSIAPIGNAKGLTIGKDNKVNIGPNPVTKKEVENGQEVNATDMIDSIIGQVSSNNASQTIDKEPQKDYNNLEAPETAPVTKQEIEPQQKRHSLRGLNGQFVKSPYNFASDKPQFDINSKEWQDEYEKARQGAQDNVKQMTGDSNPIYKDDIEQEQTPEEDIKNNPLTNSFNDMMERMNNLNKEEER